MRPLGGLRENLVAAPLVPHERFYALLYRNLIALYKVGHGK
jgi:hypothetical protein